MFSSALLLRSEQRIASQTRHGVHHGGQVIVWRVAGPGTHWGPGQALRVKPTWSSARVANFSHMLFYTGYEIRASAMGSRNLVGDRWSSQCLAFCSRAARMCGISDSSVSGSFRKGCESSGAASGRRSASTSKHTLRKLRNALDKRSGC